ncbi:MAG TPA: hypothetical protein VFM05_05915, partial [Candidatus Saccharimonadales bacterium]|nr:hypothetical protein [Candidatus Saccharimonadales bacterium]
KKRVSRSHLLCVLDSRKAAKRLAAGRGLRWVWLQRWGALHCVRLLDGIFIVVIQLSGNTTHFD